MRSLRISVILGLLLSQIPALHSAEPLKKGPLILSIEECVEAAMRGNRDLLVSEIANRTLQRKYDNRWNSLIPGIDLSTGLSRSDELFATAESSSNDPLKFSAGLSLSLSLTTGLALTMEQMRIDLEAGLIGRDTVGKQLIRDVEKEFYYLLAAAGNLELLEKDRELAQKRYEQTLENYGNGFTSELEVLQARVSATGYGPEISKERSDYENHKRGFLILLGMDPETKLELKGTLDAAPLLLDEQKLITDYQNSRQDVLAQLKVIESLENGIRISRASGYSPVLRLSGGWNSSVGEAFKGDSWSSENWTDSVETGLTLSIPLDGYIPGSSQKTELKGKSDRLAEAALKLSSLQDSARMEIINLNRTIITALETLEQSARNMELARRSYEMTEKSYEMGTAERLDVEDAQQSWLSARQQYLTGQYSYLAGLIDMKYALNLDDMGELYRLNRKEDPSAQ
jgi:multidrug efflux system outer membrane protein